MRRLLEVEYEDIFSPKTMATLKGKSGESLQQMLGDKSLMQTLSSSQKLLGEIIDAEKGYHDLLEAIAVEIATEAYPIIDYANIKIEAKINSYYKVEEPLKRKTLTIDNKFNPLDIKGTVSSFNLFEKVNLEKYLTRYKEVEFPMWFREKVKHDQELQLLLDK